MARFVTTIVIFILIITISCLSLTYVVKNESVLEVYLNEMLDFAENNDMQGAFTKAKEFTEKWEQTEPYIIMMVRHNTIDEITIRSSKLIAYAQYGNREDFIAEASAIRTLLNHISEDEMPLLHNFL